MRRIDVPKEIEIDYIKWCDFLEKHVDFWLKTSDMHTKEHCSRVLLFALLIGKKLGISEQEKEILCHASVFHDSRRQDDWLDVGHGRRAAEYYKEYCSENELTFQPWAYNVMAYHDRDDDFGIKAMSTEITGREILIYQIFKDADALDRFRLGSDGLDIKYLRTDVSKSLYDFAKKVWGQYEQMMEDVRKTIRVN